MFLSVALLNSESWLNLTQADVNELEQADRLLMRQILGTSSSCPSSALYLEMGCVEISLIIKAKRIMFLHYIVSRDEGELISKIFFQPTQHHLK